MVCPIGISIAEEVKFAVTGQVTVIVSSLADESQSVNSKVSKIGSEIETELVRVSPRPLVLRRVRNPKRGFVGDVVHRSMSVPFAVGLRSLLGCEHSQGAAGN